jgi:glutaminase
MMHELSRLCGGRRIGFNNSVFLAEKQKRLTSLAISYYCKGMGVYPEATDPTQTAQMLFQAEAVETNTENLAIMASTLANIGTCPLTQERCFAPHVMRSVLSLMYNSGLNRFSGNWAFQVGIPAASGSSGATILVIPGVMGIGIYSPRLNKLGVSPRALKLCQMLTVRCVGGIASPSSLFLPSIGLIPVAGAVPR